jgi:hypothetical protein
VPSCPPLPLGSPWTSAGSLYIADQGNNRIRKVSNGVITTVAGNGTQGFSGDNGPATNAQMSFAQGVAVDFGQRLRGRHLQLPHPPSDAVLFLYLLCLTHLIAGSGLGRQFDR